MATAAPRTVQRRKRANKQAETKRKRSDDDDNEASDPEEQEEQVRYSDDEMSDQEEGQASDSDEEGHDDDQNDDEYEQGSSDEEDEQQDDERDEDYDVSSASSRKRRRRTAASSSSAAKKASATRKKKGDSSTTLTSATTSSKRSTTIKTGKVSMSGAAAKRKKTAAATKKKSATTTTGAPAKKKARKSADDSVFITNEIPNSLFAMIRRGEASVSDIVNEWMDRFNHDNKMDAVGELISFAIQSCGCAAEFNVSTIHDEARVEQVIDSFVGGFPVDMPDYPIISSHPSLKNFNKYFVEFWDTLIRSCQEEILFDDDFMEHLLTWLTAMSSSKVRAFRHTSCLALYSIFDTLIDVNQNSIKKDLSKVEKQLQAAQKKKGEAAKIQQLSDQCSEMQQRIIALDGHMTNIFDGVFANRFKDTVPNIRALTLESLGGWILEYPSRYLTNKCLKYIGWGLNDEIPSIRSKNLLIISKLFNTEAFHAKLSPFARKFLPRIVEMAVADPDISTSTEAIQLLTVLLRHKILGSKPEVHDDMIKKISKLLYDENQSVRHYASIFIFHNMAKLMVDKSKATRTASKQKAKKKLDVDLEDLMFLMREHSSECPLIPYYVAENFWKLTGCVKDYKEIIDYLTDREDELQSEEDTLNLIRLLTASVQKVNEQLTMKTSTADNAKIPKRAKKQQENERVAQQEEMTGIVAAALPQLFTKYQAEPEKIQELVQIPKQLNLEAFTEHHLESDFDEILKLLRDIFWKYSEPIVLRHIAQAFDYLIKQDYTLRSQAKIAFDEIIREMINKLQEAVSSLENEDMGAKEKNFAVLVSLQRIKEFTLVMDVDLEGLHDELSNILDSKVNGGDIDDHSAQIILTILWQKLIWRRISLESQTEITSDDITDLKERRDKLVSQIIQILAGADESETTSDLELASYYYLCDLFLFFAPYPPKDASDSLKEAYEQLVINLSADQVEKITKFFDRALSKELEVESTQQEEDEVLNKKHEIQKQRIVVALSNAICKSTASDKLSRVVLSHFASHGPAVEEAVKSFAHALKKADESTLWDHEFEAMKRKFAEYVSAPANSNTATEKYEQFVNLVNRLALQHFWGKDTKHIALVIRMCLQYTFDKIVERHRFLDGLTKYAVKLSKEDAKDIIEIVNEHSEACRSEDLDEDVISSVVSFKKLLVNVSQGSKSLSKQKDDKQQSEDQVQASDDEEEEHISATPVVSRAGQTKKRRTTITVNESVTSEEQEQSEGDDETQMEDEPVASSTEESRGEKRARTEEVQDEDDETQISQEVEEDEDIIVQTPAKKQKL